MKLTPARKEGLRVLGRAEYHGISARVSNITSFVRTTQNPPRWAVTVYWQTADALREAGLAEGGADSGGVLKLTEAGRALLDSLYRDGSVRQPSSPGAGSRAS